MALATACDTGGINVELVEPADNEEQQRATVRTLLANFTEQVRASPQGVYSKHYTRSNGSPYKETKNISRAEFLKRIDGSDLDLAEEFTIAPYNAAAEKYPAVKFDYVVAAFGGFYTTVERWLTARSGVLGSRRTDAAQINRAHVARVVEAQRNPKYDLSDQYPFGSPDHIRAYLQTTNLQEIWSLPIGGPKDPMTAATEFLRVVSPEAMTAVGPANRADLASLPLNSAPVSARNVVAYNQTLVLTGQLDAQPVRLVMAWAPRIKDEVFFGRGWGTSGRVSDLVVVLRPVDNQPLAQVEAATGLQQQATQRVTGVVLVSTLLLGHWAELTR